MSVFKHRFTVKKIVPKQEKPKTVKHEPVGVDGAQAGESILKWEGGTIFRRSTR